MLIYFIRERDLFVDIFNDIFHIVESFLIYLLIIYFIRGSVMLNEKAVLRYLKKFGKFVAKVGRIHFPIYKNV